MDRARFGSLIEAIHAASSDEDIHRLLKKAADLLGVENFLFCSGVLAHDSQRYFNTMFKERPLCFDNYPIEWAETYLTENLLQSDVTAHRSLQSVTPVIWHQEATSRDPVVRNFFGLTSDHQIKSGLTVPIHGHNRRFGFWSLSFDSESVETKRYVAEISYDAQLLAQHFHAATDGLRQHQDRSVTLTPRERETLMGTASGKTLWEISQILAISERTAKQHMLNVMRKLDAANKTQAVARGIAFGLIDII